MLPILFNVDTVPAPADGMTTSVPELKALADRLVTAESVEAAGQVLLDFDATLESRGVAVVKNGWRYHLRKWGARMVGTGTIPGTIFGKGNGKLPFYTFSALPGTTCPGAGDCLSFCYSFKAWRYPSSFLRQVGNTLRLRFAKRQIIDAFRRIPATNKAGKRVTVRLYVDGDIDSRETAVFWWNLIRQRPELLVYGYSKSWGIIEETAHLVPDNYTLNLSGGSKYSDDSREATSLIARDFTRGFYKAVKTAENHGKSVSRYLEKAYHADVRKSAGEPIFSCPGLCGSCRVSAGIPACADRLFHVTIGNGVH